jgi:multidrug efflux pump subunit AcrB
MQDLDAEEKAALLADLMRINPTKGDFSLERFNINPVTTITGKHATQKVDGYTCKKYNI